MVKTQSRLTMDSDQRIPGNEGLNKRTFLKTIALACFGIAPFLNTCGIMNSGDSNQGPAKRPDTSAKNGSVSKAARPPIDLAASARIETATFALG